MEVVKNTKNAQYDSIPEKWKLLSIQELIDNNEIIGHLDGNHGALYPKSHEFSSFGIPYVTANDFETGVVDFSKVRYLPYWRAKQFQKGISIDGDVLFAHNATVGPTALLRTNYEFVILSTTATYFRTNHQKLDNKFFCYLIQSPYFVSQYKAVMGQSTRNQVPITQQRKLNVVLPPLPEQKAIAEVLSDTDNLIQFLEKQIAKKRMIKQGAMQKLLSPKEGWTAMKLGAISQIQTGSKNNQDKISDGEYPFFVRSQTIEKINSYSYDCEAILIPGEGGIGNIFHYINGKFDVHQRVYKISGFHENVVGKYIYLFMKMNFGSHALKNTVKATVDSLRLPTFLNFPIHFPRKQMQQQIVDTLFGMESEIEQLYKKLQKLKLIKQGLMQSLLTGRIRIK